MSATAEEERAVATAAAAEGRGGYGRSDDRAFSRGYIQNDIMMIPDFRFSDELSLTEKYGCKLTNPSLTRKPGVE